MNAIYRPKPGSPAREYAEYGCNPYQGTCLHGCRYCYNSALQHRFHREGLYEPKPGFLDALQADCARLAKRGVQDRVQLTFAGDPYPPGDNFMTRQCLQAIKSHGLRFQILTKGGGRARRDFDLYTPGPDGDWFGQTQLFMDQTLADYWEPGGVTDLESRQAAAREARARGIYTWCSLEPVLNVDEALRVIRETGDCYDEYRVGKPNRQVSSRLLLTDDYWTGFAYVIMDALQRSGRRWMLKASLAALLPQGVPPRGEPT